VAPIWVHAATSVAVRSCRWMKAATMLSGSAANHFASAGNSDAADPKFIAAAEGRASESAGHASGGHR